MMKNRFKRSLARFARQTDGTVVVETVLVMPLLFFTVMSMFTYWDVFRSMNVMQKAAYTVSDVISRQRENNGVTSADLIGFKRLMNYLIESENEAIMRVTSLTWSQPNNRFEVLWSCSPENDMQVLTTSDLAVAGMIERIPVMANADTVILVEASVDYVPFFDIGFAGSDLAQFIVTRPRLAPRIDLEACT